MVKEVNNAPESYDDDNDNVVLEDETAVCQTRQPASCLATQSNVLD